MAAFPPATRARRAGLAGAVCAVLAVSLAACAGDPDAGTNGVGKLSAEQIEAKARAAADAAKAVSLSGTLIGKGGSYQLDMRLNAQGGTGSVTSRSSTFALLRIGDALYVKAGADFWKQTGGKDGTGAAGKLDDKYVKVPKSDPAYDQFRGFTDMHALLGGLLGLHGSLGKGDRTKVGGVPAVQVTGGDGKGGRLDVSLKGTPYPLRFERAGGAGTLQLTQWNSNVTLVPPGKGDTVDYGHELPTS
ncbi:hypothetical protein [Streptomyces sp. NBC_00859]|uniref:hypothetical protein n=1 Tax=Streptomyces sp. NBC_00859 TaxID=2903682 RepID=UPI0038669AEB|nr:hypothetical protein OG584_11160 [Streptomyces sp. NBC_00859]